MLIATIGGNLEYDNSVPMHGSVIYGDANASAQYAQASTSSGHFEQGASLDFGRLNTALLGLSSSYGAMMPTDKLRTHWGAGTLTGGSGTCTDGFSLTAAQLGNVYALLLIGLACPKSIMNVTGTDFG